MKHSARNTACALAAAGVAMSLLGSGVATADPDVVGKRYSEAKSMFSEVGLTPVVATMIGDRVPQDQCYVSSTSHRSSLDSSGVSTGNLINVNLSCYAKPATARGPGFSAGNTSADAEAVRATSEQETKDWKQTTDGQKWCAAAEIEHPEWGPIADCPTPAE